MQDIPVIDLSQPDPVCAAAIAAACERIGFYAVARHGIATSLIDALQAASGAFFDLPLEEKSRVARPRPDQNRGFIGRGEETLARLGGRQTPPDDKEVFTIGPIDAGADPYFTCAEAYPHFAPNLWPARPAELRGLMEEYWRAATDLARRLLRLSAIALDLPADRFEAITRRHISMLRLIDYPARSSPPAPGQLRAGEHTDLNMLTLLVSDTDVGGVEARRRDGAWIPVPLASGLIAVNIGDVLMRWTNDRWISTPHRVANAPAGLAVRRRSVAFFFQAEYDAELACLPSCVSPDNPARYDATTIGAYRASRFAATAG
ncbi:MAG: isopenicillin N synthase family dioxygenase [Elsteraceae bacterium]